MNMFPLPHGKRLLTILAVTAFCALFVATLWPMNPWPRNEVSWLVGEDGMRFGDHGTIFSVAEFPREAGAENEPFTLEFWMEPAIKGDSNVMIAFYAAENPEQFILRRDESDVVLLHRTPETGEKRPHHHLIAPDTILPGRKTLITVTAAAPGTTLYVNGRAKQSSRSSHLSRKDLNGELVVGNSPTGNNSWSGILHCIAIYKKALTPQEVAGHYSAWVSGRQLPSFDAKEILALYKFSERSGSLVKNEIRPGVDLYIPKHYAIWRPILLAAPWREFRPDMAYVTDVIVNVLGFVPLGLILYPYFHVARGAKRPWLLSYITGALVSLVIELLQSFIPTRYSGWTDVITNSSGTALGAAVYLSGYAQVVLKKIFGEEAGVKSAYFSGA